MLSSKLSLQITHRCKIRGIYSIQVPATCCCNLRIGVKYEDTVDVTDGDKTGCNLRIGIKYEALNLHCDTILNYNHIFVKQQKAL